MQQGQAIKQPIQGTSAKLYTSFEVVHVCTIVVVEVCAV
jgi:hypothetical protein